MVKDKLHTISDKDAIEVARILLTSHLPYTYDFDKMTRVKYNIQDGVDAEEAVNVYFDAKVTNESYKSAGWKNKKISVQLIERDHYHNRPYFAACSRKADSVNIHNFPETVFLSNQIEAIEFLQSKKLI